MTIAIVGAGSIGVAFAIVFARAGHVVRVQDPDATRRAAVRPEMTERLVELARHGLFDGDIGVVTGRVTTHDDMAAALDGATHVQENAPERLEVKRGLFAAFERHAPADAVLASSSSAITASAMAGDLATRHRCLVVHPGNPPYLIPVVELVPAPFTSPDAMQRTEALFMSVGMMPVVVRKEIEGFVFNRLQGAMLREAYCLVRDGVISVDDLDRVVRDGLGLRWSVIGPFETADLNTRGGISAHAERMGAAYARMGAERGQNDPWTADLVGRVAAERRAVLPIDEWEARVRWRDRALMGMVAARAKRPSWPENET